jgi:exodeoxyribonuclease III
MENISGNLKVITWNCNMAFRKKYQNILSCKPDLLIVPECEHPDKFKDCFYSNYEWIGNNKNKGLGVFSFNGIKLSVHKSYCEDFKYVLPIEVIVNNKNIMNLIAVWAQKNDELDTKRRYIGNVWCALNHYKELLETPIIIAGDFNWNVIWDNGKYKLYGTLTDIINLLGEYGIHSTYHSIPDAIFGTNTIFGYEKDPTLFLHKNKDEPYHIDYIFASGYFIDEIESCFVGKRGDWIALSDHMPIFAEYKQQNSKIKY